MKLTPPLAFLAAMITVVFGGAGILSLFSLVAESGNEFEVTRVVPAPDGTRRAVLVDGMGGGAAGWCRRYVLVQPATAAAPSPTSVEAARDSAAFSASCGSEIALAWRSAEELLVTYTVSGRGVSVSQHPTFGGVRLSYEISSAEPAPQVRR